MERTWWIVTLCLLGPGISTSLADTIPFDGKFTLPAEQVVWAALNEPTAREMELAWKPIDPRKDPSRPDDFWRQWPTPFSPFYAGVKMPAEPFTLAALYPNHALVYPHATYEGNPDYETFFDLHESLAWLYAFQSPGNPFYKSRALRLRAQQLALAHLVGMTQDVPAGNIIGGWAIQYGNCVAWSAHTLSLLDATESLDPALKRAWIDCLDHIVRTLDAQGPEVLETGMGHWNLWPVAGAFYLWQASGREEHRALFEKWARMQLKPDAFTSGARLVSGMSPAGYIRYSGVDLGYNGQAKNWMAPLFQQLGPDSLVGDFARRQYRFASFVTLEEPDGNFSSPMHMNSHSTQSVPFEQWSMHKHLAYATHIPDAVPFASRLNPSLSTSAPTAAADGFRAGQEAMTHRTIKLLPPMAFGVRSYPSNYLNLPPALTSYPKEPVGYLPAAHTRPMEHLAYAQFFPSRIVRDEWFMRRTPGYHVTLFAGPCRDEVSNAGGHLNGIGSGGLSHVWTASAGTMLIATTDLVQNPSVDGDFDKAWSQLPVNALVAQTKYGKVICTGWTGALMSPPEDGGRRVRIEGGIAESAKPSYGTPMTDRVKWTRQITFGDRRIDIELTADAGEPLTKAFELLPVAFFADTKVTATTAQDQTIAGPWDGEPLVRAIHVRRPGGGIDIKLATPLRASWANTNVNLGGACGTAGVARSLRIDVSTLAQGAHLAMQYNLELPAEVRTPPIARIENGAALPKARVGEHFELALEAPAARAVKWSVSRGRLPDGLTLDARGLLSGTPTTRGPFRFALSGENPYHGRPFNEPDVAVDDVLLSLE